MIPSDFVPRSVRGLHGTEIDGVPVVWEPESTWATDEPIFHVIDEHLDRTLCLVEGEICDSWCWCKLGLDLRRPEVDETGTATSGYSRYTPEYPPPRFDDE